MNLCLVCRDVNAHAPSGLVRATCDLAETLAELGHDVHLLSDRSVLPPPDLSRAVFEPLTVPAASGPFRGAAPETARHNLLHAAAVYREVKRIHEHEQPVDAVLAPLWRSEGAVCLLDDRFPTVVSCMTSLQTLMELDGSYRQLEDIEERLTLEREALARSPYLHGLTHAALSKTISDHRLAPVATAVIGRGLRDRVGGTPQPASARSGQADSGLPELLFVGRIERRKGVDILLEAVAELLAAGVRANLTLAGPDVDPSFRTRFERDAAQRPQLAGAVRFSGAVTDAELARLYAEADIVCIPSRYESHGVVLLEAMMFGKALITCDAGGISEVVEAGRNALLSPPGDVSALADSLRRLLADHELRAELGVEARATFERRFDAREVARQMESFLSDVAEIHRASARLPGDVASRLAELLQEVTGVAPEAGSALAAELLDPAAGEPLRRLRAATREPGPRPSTAPQKTIPRITAIVLAHNRPELLARALDSLSASEPAVETIVIDNASTPTNARRVATVCAARERVTLERSAVNLGTVGGRLLGVDLSDSDLLLFLDDDAELLPGALSQLVAELDAHPQVGAVTATVVSSDGSVAHSGGWFERTGELVTFGLIGSGTEFGRQEVPPSGEAGWVPGTAVLVRRALLEEFPLDGQMAAYFEDNEWCYRISLTRPGSFRRSREALVLHQMMSPSLPGLAWTTIAYRVELLAAAARFYQRHGALLAPWLFDKVLPDLGAVDGTRDFASAKVLMELLAAKGSEWTVAAWNRGDLAVLLNGHRDARQAESELESARAALEASGAELEHLRRAIAVQEETLDGLRLRHEVLCRIEEGGWWKLRGRILPVVQAAGAVRRRLRGIDRADQSPLA